ncbi:MAG: holo-ACP synthase [Christensenellaceae bacterium]|jgi:holo-[acyl-carrier protein] synthase|nr:holo-ACP synthase [Christensenellaceae bacterium]
MLSIGIDIEEVSRFEQLDNAEKIYSSGELEYIEAKNFAADTIAGIFCAKEAYFKAIGTGVQLNKLKKVEIGHDRFGAPYYKNDKDAHLSIAHTKESAVAVCVILK